MIWLRTPPSKKKKGIEKPVFLQIVGDLYVDTEFSALGGISIQVVCKLKIEEAIFSFKFIILDSSFCLKLKNLKFDIDAWAEENQCYYFFMDLRENPVQNPVCQKIIDLLYNTYNLQFDKRKTLKFNLNFFFYYSPHDVNYSFGRAFMKKQYTAKASTVYQNRCLGGYFSFSLVECLNPCYFKITLKDLSGLEKYGLSTMASTYQINFKKDPLLDNYKEKMDEALLLYPKEFLTYGLRDATVLDEIMAACVKGFNDIMKDCLGIHNIDYYFTTTSIPMTIGSLVAQVFLKYLNSVVFKDDLSIQTAMFRNGIISRLSSSYGLSLKFMDELKTLKSLNEIKEELQNNIDFAIRAQKLVTSRSSLKYRTYQYASAQYITEMSVDNELYTTSIVSGGRVINEQPNEVYIENAADFDISQAYGGELNRTIYPIGRPNIYTSIPGQDKTLSLREFMRKYRKDLKLGLYKIIVEGKLSFKQDLIYSRVISQSSVEKRVSNLDPEDPDTYTGSAPHVLLQNEILKGVITRDVYEKIELISTVKEKKEFLDLKVLSAIY